MELEGILTMITTAFNQTKMELKFFLSGEAGKGRKTFNQTKMELKLKIGVTS